MDVQIERTLHAQKIAERNAVLPLDTLQLYQHGMGRKSVAASST